MGFTKKLKAYAQKRLLKSRPSKMVHKNWESTGSTGSDAKTSSVCSESRTSSRAPSTSSSCDVLRADAARVYKPENRVSMEGSIGPEVELVFGSFEEDVNNASRPHATEECKETELLGIQFCDHIDKLDDMLQAFHSPALSDDLSETIEFVPYLKGSGSLFSGITSGDYISDTDSESSHLDSSGDSEGSDMEMLPGMQISMTDYSQGGFPQLEVTLANNDRTLDQAGFASATMPIHSLHSSPRSCLYTQSRPLVSLLSSPLPMLLEEEEDESDGINRGNGHDGKNCRGEGADIIVGDGANNNINGDENSDTIQSIDHGIIRGTGAGKNGTGGGPTSAAEPSRDMSIAAQSVFKASVLQGTDKIIKTTSQKAKALLLRRFRPLSYMWSKLHSSVSSSESLVLPPETDGTRLVSDDMANKARWVYALNLTQLEAPSPRQLCSPSWSDNVSPSHDAHILHTFIEC